MTLKALVTGGAGFVGSALCQRLVDKGQSVTALDNMSNANINNIRNLLNKRNFALVVGDVRDCDLVRRASRNVDTIYHLAAQIHVDRSIIYPKMTFEINTVGTLNVLDAARENDVKRVIYASTSEVYGTAQKVPMPEDHPLNPASPYAASKAAADRLCFSYYETYGLNVMVVRSFNTYGPRQKDTGYASAIPMFIKRVLAGKPPIVYGDGNQTRDYLYIVDSIRAYELLSERDDLAGGTINFGTGTETTINDLASLIIRLSGRSNLTPVHASPRPGEVRRLCADITKAESIGWSPQHCLEKGIREEIEWYERFQEDVWLDDTSGLSALSK